MNDEPLAIASGGLLDPDIDDPADAGEKPEAVPLAIDGDPATFWFTYSYKSPDFAGLKKSTGYTFTLDEPATVQRVVLSTNNTGGAFELRAVTPDAPDGGALASGTFADTVELELDPPTEGTTFVLLVTELPRPRTARTTSSSTRSRSTDRSRCAQVRRAHRDRSRRTYRHRSARNRRTPRGVAPGAQPITEEYT
ncbi:hypothetical protein NKG05_12780 [Oerskovia sp. M15]